MNGDVGLGSNLGDIGPTGGFFDIGIGDIIIPDMSSLTGWIDYWANLFLENLQFDRRDYPQVSLGSPQLLEIPTIPGDELSNLVIAEVPPGTPTIPNQAVSDISAVGNVFDMEEWRGIQQMQQQGILPTMEDEYMGFFDDLGDLAIDVAGEFARRDLYTPGRGMAPVGMAAPMGYDFSTGGGGPSFSSDDPLVAPLQSAAVCDTGPSPVYKKVCGVYKWVYPKRRRRRQLLTDSDYNGLLRIESLKVNKNMTIAIAKALTR